MGKKLMEFYIDLDTNMDDQAYIDAPVLVVAFVTLAAALVMTTLTCVCCDGKGSSFNRRSSSRRDTVPLEDLLSKPSLADPESVFSEADSYQLSRSIRAASWMRESGEGSSCARQSGSISGVSVDETINDTFPGAVLHNPNFEFQAQWNLQTHAQTPKDRQQQCLSVSSKSSGRIPFPESHTIVESGRYGNDLIHNRNHNVKAAGSPKNYNHKDFSERVRVDSASLKIHRDSVTRESVPFLSSTRCSFSHEVGHTVHGTKVPRTSLPTTEEQDDVYSKRSSGLSNESPTSGHKTLSIDACAEQLGISCLEKAVINTCEHTSELNRPEMSNQNTDDRQRYRHGDVHTDSKSQSHDITWGDKPSYYVWSKKTEDTNIGRIDESQHVAMRRCVSCIHGDSDEQLSRPRRKTFSLNLKIDVHFENVRGSNENLSTVVCSPRIDYDHCDRCATISDDRNAGVASEKNEKCLASSESMVKHLVDDSVLQTNEVSDSIDNDAKEKLLQKSFELKSQKLRVSQPFVMVHKRRSEPTIIVNSSGKDCNLRQFSRLSESGSPIFAAPKIKNNNIVEQGLRVPTVLGHDLCRSDARQTDSLNCSKVAPIISSRNDSVRATDELTVKTTTTALKPSIECLNLQAEKIKTEREKSPSSTISKFCQRSGGEYAKASQTSENVNINNSVVGVCNDVIIKDESCKQSVPNANTKIEACLGIIGEEHRDRQSACSNSSSHHNETIKTFTSLQNKIEIERKLASSTPTASKDGGISFVCSDICGGDTARSVVELVPFHDHHTAYQNVHHEISPPAEVNFNVTQTHSDTEDVQPVNEVAKEAEQLTRAFNNGRSLYDCHRRAQTVKKRYGWTTAEATESRFMRTSSLKAQSSDKRVQQILLVQGHDGQAVALKSDDKTNFQACVDTEHLSIIDPEITAGMVRKDQRLILASRKKLCNQENKNISSQKQQSIDVTLQVIKKKALIPRVGGQDIPETSLLDATEQTMGIKEGQGESTDIIFDKIGNERVKLSGQRPGRCMSEVSFKDEGSTIEIELCQASDDSDYDNPWDDLDDAVKRASIRYNRRPSRIAAGDTKTLLLKSAEDLGRLLEEADKRRQLSQSRNSYQITSPEGATESMTIPFTRYSPHRHTVKGIVSPQTHSISTEDILQTQSPTYPKLNLLRPEDDSDRTSKAIDVRRPMSLTSKVKAKVTGLETKKQKK